MKYLVTALFWVVFLATCWVEFLCGALLWLLTAPFDKDRRVLHAFICRWTFGYLRLNPAWDVKVCHRERLPNGPCVLIANHQSMADILAAMGLFHPFKFVSKSSLFKLPLVGWMMTMLGYVSVDRARLGSMQEMMDACRFWLRRGMPVLIYPEGTYAPDGRLLPFKRGAFQLAIQEKVPLVPVLLEGTRSLVVGDGPWMSPTCRIRVTVMPPVEVAALGADDAALLSAVRKRYEQALTALAGGAKAQSTEETG